MQVSNQTSRCVNYAASYKSQAGLISQQTMLFPKLNHTTYQNNAVNVNDFDDFLAKQFCSTLYLQLSQKGILQFLQGPFVLGSGKPHERGRGFLFKTGDGKVER